MKTDQVTLGMQVVVSSDVRATVFVVDGKAGFTVKLKYKEGDAWLNGGYADVSMLKRPTKAQLRRARK